MTRLERTLVTGWVWLSRMLKKQIRKNFVQRIYQNFFSFRVDVNLKYETYCNAISDGSNEEWDFAWKRYENSHVASEKSTILSALGCTKEVWLLNR